MTPIEQLAKEFSKGNPATEAAFLAGAKQARLQDIEMAKIGKLPMELEDRKRPNYKETNLIWNEALDEMIIEMEKLL